MPKLACSNYQSKSEKLNQLEAPQSKRKEPEIGDGNFDGDPK